jgi:hypothetical protein
MILGNPDSTFPKRRAGPLAIEPRRSHETIDAPSDHIFEQRSAFGYPAGRILKREAQEFAFSGSHEAGTEAVGTFVMPGLIAMEIAVEKDFDSCIGPSAQACRERRTGDDRSAAPMIWNDQHSEPIADEGREQIDELIDLALEARRDIMDRC